MLSRIGRYAFRLLYHELAFTYDGVSRAVSLGHWRLWQRSVLRFMPPPSAGPILELAQGTGDLQIDLQRAGYATIALDRSLNMNRLARRKLHRHGLRADCVQADALALPLGAGAIRLAVCTFPSNFLFQRDTLDELARVLAPGGRLIVVLIGQLHGRGVIKWLIHWLYWLTGQRDTIQEEAEISGYFTDAGFEIETHVVRFDGSAAQLAVLTQRSMKARIAGEPGLEKQRDPC